MPTFGVPAASSWCHGARGASTTRPAANAEGARLKIGSELVHTDLHTEH
ncbi:MAG TPA: hypothetical protein VH372_18960 [Actinospica sp.]|nr:hypothetical protein [Actinospica sp.]